jgi:hypothetical protein
MLHLRKNAKDDDGREALGLLSSPRFFLNCELTDYIAT